MLVTLVVMLTTMFVFDVSNKPYGNVPATRNVSDYGFGTHKFLVVLNLTAYRTSDTSDVAERGLNGAHDIHPSHKRYAQITVYKDNAVFNNVWNHPVAIDQKGGDRPQINIGIEFRDPGDIAEDDKAELLDDIGTDLEDYFLRGCYFEGSCTRDFAPTVMDVTPQKKGELVEVLFWQDEVGYTYEGVYGLFAKMKRKYYQKSVPWASKGKIDKKDPCSDEVNDIAIVFESEVEREGRGSYNAFERMVEADMVYPSSSNEAYLNTWRDNCTEKYDQALDYYHLPNMLNRSAVPLNVTTFVQMYMASQLMQQVDFGFRGAQQYYYKSPGSMHLMTGPPYDFDAPWDVCGMDKETVDIVTCHGESPSPIWAHMGRNEEFIRVWKTTGLDILDRNMVAVRALYSDSREMYNRGYFMRHEERWDMTGRIAGDLGRNLIALFRQRGGRETVGDEIDFQLRWYEERYAGMRRNIPASHGFDVHVSRNAYVLRFLQVFWWVFVFGVGPCLCLCVVLSTRSAPRAPQPIVVVTTQPTGALRRELDAKRHRDRL